MKKNFYLFAITTLLLSVVNPIHAQQPGKVFRIGFLDPSTASGSAGLLEVFLQELGKLGWIEGKNLSSSTGLVSKRLSACLSLRRIWFVLRLI